MTRGRLSRFSDPDIESSADALAQLLDAIAVQPFIRDARARLLEGLRVSNGDRVLDVGCGLGDTTAELARHVAPNGLVVGIDISENLLSRAAERHQDVPGLEFMQADVCSPPFESGYFSHVRSERVLQHVASPAAAMVEISRMMRHGGIAAFLEPDWGTLTLDHPDTATTAEMLEFLRTAIRTPLIGRHLPQLASSAKLQVCDFRAMPWLVNDYEDGNLIVDFDRLTKRAIDSGMTISRVETWSRQIRDNSFVASMDLNFLLARKSAAEGSADRMSGAISLPWTSPGSRNG